MRTANEIINQAIEEIFGIVRADITTPITSDYAIYRLVKIQTDLIEAKHILEGEQK